VCQHRWPGTLELVAWRTRVVDAPVTAVESHSRETCSGPPSHSRAALRGSRSSTSATSASTSRCRPSCPTASTATRRSRDACGSVSRTARPASRSSHGRPSRWTAHAAVSPSAPPADGA
jgi:hypothetical protein